MEEILNFYLKQASLLFERFSFFSVVLDKGSKKDIGQFELLYRQPPFVPCPRSNSDSLQITGHTIRAPPLPLTARTSKSDIQELPDSSSVNNSTGILSPETHILRSTVERLTPVLVSRKSHAVASARAKTIIAPKTSEKKRPNVEWAPTKVWIHQRKAATTDSVVSTKATVGVSGKPMAKREINKAIRQYSLKAFNKIEGAALSIDKLTSIPNLNSSLDTDASHMVDPLLWINKVKSILENTQHQTNSSCGEYNLKYIYLKFQI